MIGLNNSNGAESAKPAEVNEPGNITVKVRVYRVNNSKYERVK